MPLYRIGKVWYVDLASRRGRLRRSTGTTDKRQAQAYITRLEREIWEQERLGKAPSVTWGEAVKRWVEVKNPGMPDRYRLRRLEFSLSEPLPISGTAVSEECKGLAHGSWNRLCALIASIHKISGVTPPVMERRPSPPGRTRWLTKKEWVRLRPILDTHSPLLRQAADFTLATGLRENNVLNLQWSQVDLKRRRLFIEAGQIKNRSALGLPLNDSAMVVLKERKGLHKTFVFAHPDSGKPLYKASNRAWYEAVKKAGLKGFRWHDLRHSWASWAIMSGVSLMELKELGGWKTMSMVARYAHLAPDHLADAANRIKPVG